MSVTKKDIRSHFPMCGCIEQQGSKQLFIVYYSNYCLLVSYLTIIGIKLDHGIFQVTTEKFSPTTSKQTNQFARTCSTERVAPEILTNYLNKYHNSN